MRINGVSWTPCTAGVLAALLLGAGIDAWLAVSLGAATALAGSLALQQARQRRNGMAARAEVAALQRAVARRDRHLAQTVHELRTPLAAVVTALELLRGDWIADRCETEEVLAEATLAAGHLTNLIDDVLDDAAITAGRLQLSLGSHRVCSLLGDCHRLLRLHAERRRVRLDVAAVDDSLAIRTDPRRFLQVACNLIGNALKAAPPDSTVQLRVEAERHCVRFVVADHGRGVDADVQRRLFSPFATAAHAGGTGLGLHVSMRLVQQMGGRIGHQAPAHGTEFWFELPRAAPRPEHMRIAPVAGAAR